MEDSNLRPGRRDLRHRRIADRVASEFGATGPRPGLRTGSDCGCGDWRHVVERRLGHDTRHHHRRIHHERADQRLAHHVGCAGMADRGDRSHHHSRRVCRHLATPKALSLHTTIEIKERRVPKGSLNGWRSIAHLRRRNPMLKRKVLSIAIGVGALVGASSLAYADEPYIPLISKGFQHQFWQAVKSGAEQSAKEHNVRSTFEGPETEAMVDKQIDMLSAALAEKPQALGIAALDSKAAIPLLERAQSSKTPVIAFDSGVDSDIPLTTCATDNLAAAALAADKMAEMIGNAGEVGVIVYDQTSRTGNDRRDGFLNEMNSKHPNVKIVSVQYVAGDHL